MNASEPSTAYVPLTPCVVGGGGVLCVQAKTTTGWVRTAELSPQLWRLRQLEQENRILRDALQERDLADHQRDCSRLRAHLGLGHAQVWQRRKVSYQHKTCGKT